MAQTSARPRPYPVPPNEDERLRELYALDLKGARNIEQIDRICGLARDLFKVPIALVTLIDDDRQNYLATCGIDIDESRREDTFCTVAILDNRPLVVQDATADPRFKDNVYVCGPPNMRFYAGAPLRLKPGINIGTICVIDVQPRAFSADDRTNLSALADLIVSELRARRAMRELAASQKRLKQTAHMAKIGGYERIMPHGKLIWDDEIYAIYGVPPGTPPAHELILAAYDPDMREKTRRRLDALFGEGVPYDVELRGARPNGETFWIRAMAEAEMADGVVTRVFGAVQDITERKQAEQRIHELAFRDPLTGLPNRLSFLDRLNAAIAAAREHASRVDLIQFDIDDFREVNDALGHHTGDMLLQKVAGALWRAFGATGGVAHIGGDEFAVILRGQPSADAATLLAMDFIAQARQLLREDTSTLPLGISAGHAAFPEHGEDAETVMKNAKVALLQAKGSRRGELVRFDPGMREAIDGRHALMRRVVAAIKNREFVMFYQPIVDLRGGKVMGLEALMRWNDPEFGLLLPGHFLPAFDDPTLSVALGEVALDAAIAQMRVWLDTGVDFGNVAVNLSTAQFRLANLAEIILGKLARANVPPHRLTLEVTENVYMAWGADVVAATVRRLHAAGVGIALDDFGTGYASLTHLRQFPIDKLKIDKSFVQSTESGAIVDAVINMGSSLGMQVVAEGVEKPEQLNLLRLKGCDLVQGYIFAKPLAPERVADYIAGFDRGADEKKLATG